MLIQILYILLILNHSTSMWPPSKTVCMSGREKGSDLKQKATKGMIILQSLNSSLSPCCIRPYDPGIMFVFMVKLYFFIFLKFFFMCLDFFDVLMLKLNFKK
jgi:hypothetical protein